MTRLLTIAAILALAVVGLAVPVNAQPLGTFRWQLQPYCNVVHVTVTQQGANYQLDGYDDQCGAPQRAPLVGMGTPNPNGSIGFGMNVVTVPGGRGVQIDARITIPALGGSWTDSAGNAGTFAFNVSTGGSPRPAPAGSASPIPSTFALLTDGGFLARGTLGAGNIPASNIGTRMMWYPKKAAFRAGQVTIPAWDDLNIGNHSTAFGLNPVASGIYSFAAGLDVAAQGIASVALGASALATGDFSTALGAQTTAGGYASTAMGLYAEATAAHAGSFVFGDASTNAVGTRVQPTGPNQFVVRAAGGFRSSAARSPRSTPTSPPSAFLG
jgi:Head domain of trimeric autotransporter adhesin